MVNDGGPILETLSILADTSILNAVSRCMPVQTIADPLDQNFKVLRTVLFVELRDQHIAAYERYDCVSRTWRGPS